MYTSDEKDKAKKRKLRSVIMIAAGALLLIVGVLLIVFAPTQSESENVMPDVIGLDRDKARAQLEECGLEVIEIEGESGKYDSDVVIAQSIAPGEVIAPGMAVELTVNIDKGGNSSVFGSAPPAESAEPEPEPDPEDEETDGLERRWGGGYNGGNGGDTGGNEEDTPADKPSEDDTPANEPAGEDPAAVDQPKVETEPEIQNVETEPQAED